MHMMQKHAFVYYVIYDFFVIIGGTDKKILDSGIHMEKLKRNKMFLGKVGIKLLCKFCRNFKMHFSLVRTFSLY